MSLQTAYLKTDMQTCNNKWRCFIGLMNVSLLKCVVRLFSLNVLTGDTQWSLLRRPYLDHGMH